MATNRVTPEMVQGAMETVIHRVHGVPLKELEAQKEAMSPADRLQAREMARVMAEELNKRMPG